MEKLEFLVDVALQEHKMAGYYKEWYEKEQKATDMLRQQLKEAQSDLRTSKQMHDELTAAHLTLHDRYAEAQRQLQNVEAELAYKDDTLRDYQKNLVKESR